MKLILLLFLFTFLLLSRPLSKVAHLPNKHITNDTAIIPMKDFPESILIDTTLNFKSVKGIANYKHKNDSLFKKFILLNNKISAQIKEKLGYDNSIRFQKLFYKYLIECNKSIEENFNYLSVIINDYVLFSRSQLLSLYNLFPEKFKNNDKGRMYLATIDGRPDNISHSIFGAGDISFQSVTGTLVPLQKLIDGHHQFYIILFTASWCGPCHYYTNVFRSDLNKLDKSEVKVISISIDKSQSEWLEYLKKEGYEWNNYRTIKGWDSKIMNYFHFETIPRYLLIDKKGIIIDEQAGYGMKQIINKMKQPSKL